MFAKIYELSHWEMSDTGASTL